MTTPEVCPSPKLRSCGDCGSTDLGWSIEIRAVHSAPGHGQMGLHDVEPVAVLGCGYCSETVEVRSVDEMQISPRQTR
jgi:hypothetical protein